MRRLPIPLALYLGGAVVACSLQMPAEDDVFASHEEGVGGSSGDVSATGGVADGSGGDGGSSGGAPGGTTSEGNTGGVGTAGLDRTGGQHTGGLGGTGGVQSGTEGGASSGGTSTGGLVHAGGRSTGGLGGTTGGRSTGGVGTAGLDDTGGWSTGGLGGAAGTQGGTPSGGSTSDAGTAGLESAGGDSSGGTGGTGGFDPEAGLVAHYPFDETDGEVAANLKDAGRNGTYVGDCTHPAGQIEGAVGLRNIAGATGTTEWVELPDGLLSDLAETTLALWVRDLSSARSGGRLFDLSRTPANGIYFSPHDTNSSSQHDGSHLRGTLGGDPFVDEWGMHPDFTDKLWHHVAVTWSSAHIDLYIDGSLVESASNRGVRPADLGVTSPNWLGRTLDDANIGLYAQIDDLRIYDRVLAADEVEQLCDLR